MTRFNKTVLTIAALTASIAATSTTAYAGDTFKASFNYDKSASAEVNLKSFKTAAATACKHQALEAGFRKTDSTNYQVRKCQRQLLKNAVKGTNDRVLMSLYQDETNGTKTTQLAMNTK